MLNYLYNKSFNIIILSTVPSPLLTDFFFCCLHFSSVYTRTCSRCILVQHLLPTWLILCFEMLDVDTLPVVLTTVAVAIAVLLFRRNDDKSDNKAGKRYPPSLPSLPIVGSLPFISSGMHVMPEFFMKTAEKLGPVFTFNAGTRHVYMSKCF